MAGSPDATAAAAVLGAPLVQRPTTLAATARQPLQLRFPRKAAGPVVGRASSTSRAAAARTAAATAPVAAPVRESTGKNPPAPRSKPSSVEQIQKQSKKAPPVQDLHEQPETPRRQAARQKWCYERVNTLSKKRQQLQIRIAEKMDELQKLSGLLAGAGSKTTDAEVADSEQQGLDTGANDDQASGGGAPNVLRPNGATDSKASTSGMNRLQKEELSDMTRERAIRRAEFDRYSQEVAKLTNECKLLAKDCGNLQRSAEKWKQKTVPNTQTSEIDVTESILQQKNHLRTEKDFDYCRKESLQSGLTDGVAVREKLQADIGKEREKLKLLEAAWVDKQASMKQEHAKKEKQLEAVASEEKALECQREVVLRQIAGFLEGEYRKTEEKYKELEELAARRLREKSDMFEQLRKLQEVHQKLQDEHSGYEGKVQSLNKVLIQAQSEWRLSHIDKIDKKVSARRGKFGFAGGAGGTISGSGPGNMGKFVPLRTGVSETLFVNAFGTTY